MSMTLENLAAIDRDWVDRCFKQCLGDEGGGVRSFSFQQIGEGVGQLGEFGILEVEKKDGGTRSFFLKVQTPSEDFHQLCLDYQYYEREVNFYQFSAKDVACRTPHPYYVEFNRERSQVLLVLEFMADWHTPDQIIGASRHQIERAIDALIPINTQYWNRTNELPWLPNSKAPFMMQLADDMVSNRQNFLARFGHLLTAGQHQKLDQIISYYPQFADVFTRGTQTLTHWDYRVENIFYSADESEVAVIDWQLGLAHKPGWDLAYLLSTNIEVAVRREIFEESLAQYQAGLVAAGISYETDKLMRNIRQAMCAITCFSVVGGGNCDWENKRSVALFAKITERLFSAIDDYDATAVLTSP
ncbi:MAG: oxidoreductase family protein [Pseudomonadales bacterium]